MTIASGTPTISQEIFDALVTDLALDQIAKPDLTGTEYSAPDQTNNPNYAEIAKLTAADLSDGDIAGPGVFDVLMRSIKTHLKEELQSNRITGDQYTKAYIASLSQALQTGTQFLLGAEQSYWSAKLAQHQAQRAEIDATTSRVALDTAKFALEQSYVEAQAKNKLSEAEYALQKLSLAVTDKDFEIKVVQKTTAEYQLDNILPAQLTTIKEQGEAQRAQTLDTRSDGDTVEGAMGKQKDLYDQQITSYQQDATYKVGKLFSDSWVAQKTLDEGLSPPNQFTNDELNVVLQKLRESVNLSAAV